MEQIKIQKSQVFETKSKEKKTNFYEANQIIKISQINSNIYQQISQQQENTLQSQQNSESRYGLTQESQREKKVGFQNDLIKNVISPQIKRVIKENNQVIKAQSEEVIKIKQSKFNVNENQQEPNVREPETNQNQLSNFKQKKIRSLSPINRTYKNIRLQENFIDKGPGQENFDVQSTTLHVLVSQFKKIQFTNTIHEQKIKSVLQVIQKMLEEHTNQEIKNLNISFIEELSKNLFCHDKFIIQKFPFLKKTPEFQVVAEGEYLFKTLHKYSQLEQYKSEKQYYEQLYSLKAVNDSLQTKILEIDSENARLKSTIKMQKHNINSIQYQLNSIQKGKQDIEAYFNEILDNEKKKQEEIDTFYNNQLKYLRTQNLQLKEHISKMNVSSEQSPSSKQTDHQQQSTCLQDQLDTLLMQLNDSKNENNRYQLQQNQFQLQNELLQAKIEELNNQIKLLESLCQNQTQELKFLKDNQSQLTPRPSFSAIQEVLNLSNMFMGNQTTSKLMFIERHLKQREEYTKQLAKRKQEIQSFKKLHHQPQVKNLQNSLQKMIDQQSSTIDTTQEQSFNNSYIRIKLTPNIKEK